MSSYQDERDHVTRLLELLAIIPDELVDPKWNIGTRLELTSSPGSREERSAFKSRNTTPTMVCQSPPSKQSRAKEKSAASKNPKGYGFSISGQYIVALKKALVTKLTKTFAGVDEGWLLVAAQNPNWRHTSSTFVVAAHISLPRRGHP